MPITYHFFISLSIRVVTLRWILLGLPTLLDYSPDPSAGPLSNRWALRQRTKQGPTGLFHSHWSLLDFCSFETFLRPVGSSLDYHQRRHPPSPKKTHHDARSSHFTFLSLFCFIRFFFFILCTSAFCVFASSYYLSLSLVWLSIVGCYYLLLSTSLSNRTSLRVAHMIALQNPALLPSAKVDISLLLKPQDEEERSPPGTTTSALPSRVVPSGPALPPMSIASSPVSGPSAPPPSITKIPASVPAKRLQPAHTAESPAKKQSKWSPEEDALIIELRGSGMKWEDISRRLPGRSAISCRLHYQNYLERRSEWDEDKKNKLARLYERYVLHFRKKTWDFHPIKTHYTNVCLTDSRLKCGQRWQRKWPFHGAPQKQCTGN